jgi:hypothetical protein
VSIVEHHSHGHALGGKPKVKRPEQLEAGLGRK